MTDGTTTRRMALALLGATLALPAAARPKTERLIAGTYTSEGGKGLYPITYDIDADRWTVGTPTATLDASYGLAGPPGAYYLVHERPQGQLATFAADWTRRATVSTEGADPCFVAIDRASLCLAVANYSSGSVAFYRIDRATGLPAEATLFRHTGSGPNAGRQLGPHAHWVGFSPDRRWLHAVDLGADAIFAYRFDATARTLAPPVVAWRAAAGAGPRHMVHHPRLPRAYVVCELSNTLAFLDARPDGSFTTRQEHSTLPPGYAGASQAAHIAVDGTGRRLYVSNRGHDSIAVFALDAQGAPSLIQHVSCGGRWPRLFRLLEHDSRLVVANERSGTLDVLRIASDGRLVPTPQSLSIPGLAFIDAYHVISSPRPSAKSSKSLNEPTKAAISRSTQGMSVIARNKVLERTIAMTALP